MINDTQLDNTFHTQWDTGSLRCRGVKRKFRSTEIKRKSYGQRFKETAMTIVSNLLPSQSPWGYMDMLWNWGYPGHGNNFQQHVPQSYRPFQHTGPEIPIQIINPSGIQQSYQPPSEIWEEWSDSDYDDFDINNSSSKVRRKRQRKRFLEKDISPDVSPVSSTDDEALKRKQAKPQKKTNTSNVENKKTVRKTDAIMDRTEKLINATCSYSVYKDLKASLARTGRQIDAIKGDGNCFFRALSKILYGNQNYYEDLRQAVVDVLHNFPKKFAAFTDGPILQHIKEMRRDKTWATQTEIYAAATLLNRDIYILSPDQTGETYSWLLFKPQAKYDTLFYGCDCYLTICHTHGNHYDRIAAVDDYCNCELPLPEMTGVHGHVDLTTEDEIVQSSIL